MKKLLILTAVLMMTAGTVGCRCCDWCSRGAQYGACAPMAPCSTPCPPPSCDPCQTSPMLTPGPAPYNGVPGS